MNGHLQIVVHLLSLFMKSCVCLRSRIRKGPDVEDLLVRLETVADSRRVDWDQEPVRIVDLQWQVDLRWPLECCVHQVGDRPLRGIRVEEDLLQSARDGSRIDPGEVSDDSRLDAPVREVEGGVPIGPGLKMFVCVVQNGATLDGVRVVQVLVRLAESELGQKHTTAGPLSVSFDRGEQALQKLK